MFPSIAALRLPFLILTPVCLFFAVALTLYEGYPVHFSTLALIVVGALSAHISVNTFNEYYDFKSGLDFKTIKTPFSGGSGALPAHPESAPKILLVAIVSLLITISIGIYFVIAIGWEIILFGLPGVLIILTYTGPINKHPFLCLIAPGIGFAFLMTAASHFILSGHNSALDWLLILLPFFLINNLLLLNQIPDIDADKQVGRQHFPIKFGIDKSLQLYLLQLIFAAIIIIVVVKVHALPSSILYTLAPLSLGFVAAAGIYKYQQTLNQHAIFLALNVMTVLLTPLSFSLLLISSR